MKKVKIQLTEKSKRLITMLDVDNIKAMIQELKNEGLESAIYEYISIAMGCVKQYADWSYYDVSMEITRNCRIEYNFYTENSADFDVWIEFKAFNEFDGFYIVGVYLSDIYSITDDNKPEIRQHMYVRVYTQKQ